MAYSASSLTRFVACEHLAAVGNLVPFEERCGSDERPLIAKLGDIHEERYLESLRESGLEVVEFPGDPINPSDTAKVESAVAETLIAMKSGADIIFQGLVGDAESSGRTDFLRRVETPSDLGDWSYEVEDTKLARKAKPSAVIQLCFYSGHLARLQGVVPEQMHVVLGDQRPESFRYRDFDDYFNALTGRYEEFVAGANETYPWPCSHCAICPNDEICKTQRQTDDHLSVVANMRRTQAERLNIAGVATIEAFAAADPIPNVRIGTETLVRLQGQAILQDHHRRTGEHKTELLEPHLDPEDASNNRNLGLYLLPEPDGGDLFFDIEGYPHGEDGNLDYLFGFWDREENFTPFWGHTRSEEKAAFEATIDFIVARRNEFPNMRVYHYAPYERISFERMMGLHGTREAEIDDLFRNGVLVDLYSTVRNSVQVSQPSYSIKYLEPIYGFERSEDELKRGDDSIAMYYTAAVEPDVHNQDLLDIIERYNRDDVHSTAKLHDWLLTIKAEAVAQFGTIAISAVETTTPGEDQVQAEAAAEALTNALLNDVPDEEADRDAAQQARFLAANVVSWHRREAKPEWWSFFNRITAFRDGDIEQFANDTECLTLGEYESSEPSGLRSNAALAHTYRFDPAQDHKFAPGSGVLALPGTGDDPDKPDTVTITDIDNLTGSIVIKKGQEPLTRYVALMPTGPVSNVDHRDALRDLGQRILSEGINVDSPSTAAEAILLRTRPRISSIEAGAALTSSAENTPEELVELIAGLDHSYLPVQGPPGTGKTWSTAQAIVELTQRGLKVGVTAFSHRAIRNLVEWIADAADDPAHRPHPLAPNQLTIVQKVTNAADLAERDRVEKAKEKTTKGEKTKDANIRLTLDDPTVVVAGTSWLFTTPDLVDEFDVLFIDEAGQMALADVLAVSRAAKSVVLVGDPQQLTQPIKGTHPPGVAVSALEHILGESSTIPEDRGVLLSVTRRLHPYLCKWTSDRFYDGRLSAHPSAANQTIGGNDWLSGAGIRWHPVEHVGCRTRSRAEAEAVAEICSQLIGRDWTDSDQTTRRLTPNDILVVAPYNAHCTEIAACAPDGVRIGTVDKLQGQEAPVAIYTLAASDPADVRRGHGFIYSPNRLNVATSRGRAIAVIVASPRMLTPNPSNLRTMRNASHFTSAAGRRPR